MKTLKLILFATLLAAFGLAQQNTLTTTTLSSALTSGSNYVVLVSSTGINIPVPGIAGSFGYVDREMFQFLAISPPGTTTNVQYLIQRGVNGTRAAAHASGQIVWIGNGDWFSGGPVGTGLAGTCVIANIYAYPVINVLDGTFQTCDSLKLWGYAGPSGLSDGLRSSVTQITATYTATYWDNIISATSGTFALTLPAAAAFPGKVYFLTNPGSGTVTVTTATGCVSMATTTACRVYSDGTAWRLF